MTNPPSRSVATKTALLNAARQLFAQRGFDLVSVRDVAADAGVNAALVIRYFGSKEALFLEAISLPDGVPLPFDGPLHDLGERLARYALGKPDADPLLILLRSASSETGGTLLRRAVEAQFIAPLSTRLPGTAPDARAALIAAEVLGLSVLSKIVNAPILKRESERVVRESARALQRLIDGDTN